MAKFSRIEVALTMKESGLVPVFFNKDIEICKKVLKAFTPSQSLLIRDSEEEHKQRGKICRELLFMRSVQAEFSPLAKVTNHVKRNITNNSSY